MSGIQWTPDQRRAITTRGRHLLVSAAAGSGKTAVLVERIAQRIVHDGGDIDRLLIVTFTDAAAAQMRDRLVKRLHDELAAAPGDAHLLRQLMLLPSASISTLHAFCLKVVRQHFYRLGLDPAIRVLDEHEAELLRLEALDRALEDMYDGTAPGDAFARLVHTYGGVGGDEALQQFLLQMHGDSRSLPDPAGWLRQTVRPYHSLGAGTFNHSPWAAELILRARVSIARAQRLVRQALAVALSPGGSASHAQSYEEDVERLGRLQQAAQAGWASLVEQRDLCLFPRLKSARGEETDPDVVEYAKKLRDRAKDVLIKEVYDALLSRSPEEELAALKSLAKPLDVLVDAILKLDEYYQDAKTERGLVDFGDIEHLCLRLLDMPEVADHIRDRFDEVLVDECQDLNGVQDAILARIARRPEEGGELFLVGDVKQSVYRFRHADPGLFLARYQRAQPGEEGTEQRIDLQANFRSRPVVLDGVNFLFRQLMTAGAAEMDYVPEAELVAGLQFPPGAPDGPVELHVLEKDRALLQEKEADQDLGLAGQGPDPEEGERPEKDDRSALQREAQYVATHIRNLVQREQVPVWDGRLGRYRPVRYGDIVVLVRAAKGRDAELVDALQAAGVPAYAELNTGYFAATEVDTMLALLKVLDNPRQDIPLAAVLRTLFRVSPEDLARLRIHHRKGDLYDAVLAAAAEEQVDNIGDVQTQGPALGSLGDTMRTVVAALDDWRTLARRAPLSKLVWRLLAETGYLDYVGALPGGRQRQANLRALYERAQQFNHFSRHGLSPFLRFVERLQDADGDLGAAPALGEADDVVRIMSVHKSKGLEFPVVYVVDTGRDMKRGGRRWHPDLAVHRELGLGAGLVDPDRRLAQPTLLLEAVRWRRFREELAEEMRLLYVALTRAKERLVVVGSVNDVDATAADWAEAAATRGWPLDDARLLAASSWLDWIGPAVMRHRDGEPLRERAAAKTGLSVPLADSGVAQDPTRWRVFVGEQAPGGGIEADKGDGPLPWAAVANLTPVPKQALVGWVGDVKATVAGKVDPDGAQGAVGSAPPVVDGDPVDQVWARVGWTYPFDDVVGRAAKQSVSELKRRWDTVAAEETVPVAPPRRRLDHRPAFLQTEGRPLTGAERGAAVHLVMQHVDLGSPLDRSSLATQIQQLVARHMLTAEQAAAVDVEPLAAFFASDVGRRLTRAPERVHREVPFTMALPAGEAYPDLDPVQGAGETVIVQGIIDCLVEEDDGLLLIDFKTDRVGAADTDRAARRYGVQLALYARAAAHMYERPVKAAYIVFLHAGQAVPVPVVGA